MWGPIPEVDFRKNKLSLHPWSPWCQNPRPKTYHRRPRGNVRHFVRRKWLLTVRDHHKRRLKNTKGDFNAFCFKPKCDRRSEVKKVSNKKWSFNIIIFFWENINFGKIWTILGQVLDLNHACIDKLWLSLSYQEIKMAICEKELVLCTAGLK